MRSAGEVETFGFYIADRFPLMSFSAMTDILLIACELSAQEIYRWHTIASGIDLVHASNGLRVLPDHDLKEVFPLDSLIVCSGYNSHKFSDASVLAWIRKLHTSGAKIGAVGTGTWILAKAGILEGRRSTVHWEDLDALREAHPSLEISANLFEIDGRIFTCCGGTAAIDLFLSFIAEKHGIEFATAVAVEFMYRGIRPAHEHQRDVANELGVTHSAFRSALQLMEKNVEAPISLGEINSQVGLSGRQLERLFRKHAGRTPQLFYRDLRLNHAKYLIRQSDMPISQVASACGFGSSAYLATCYKSLFGRSPSVERHLANPNDNRGKI